ncbi:MULTISPECIES: hypothetical protein [unclassified Paenibacillus]|uniref:hypothetical protein n=1 Tax=unclassified Paenibacillus TaxID=185978 RepID=UPI0015C4A1A4|nr:MULTISPECIES: hypothetical protein [unclassified Paenibacillus]
MAVIIESFKALGMHGMTTMIIWSEKENLSYTSNNNRLRLIDALGRQAIGTAE